MKTWSFANGDGVFTGKTFSAGDDTHLADNTPPGCVAIPGRHDWRRCRAVIDDQGGVLRIERKQPDKPADTELQTWAWDDVADDWLPVPTGAALDAAARRQRADLLAACDWVVARAIESGDLVPQDWRLYRQALRDVTAQPGWPFSIDWPCAPTS